MSYMKRGKGKEKSHSERTVLDDNSYLMWTTLREENKFGRKECGIKYCELDL